MDSAASSQLNTVQTDLPCVGCGYNLRGIGVEGQCPECGTATTRSLSGDRLDAADPKWLAKVVWGQRLLSHGLSCSAMSAILIVAGGIAAIFLAMAPSSSWLMAVTVVVLLAFVMVFYGGLLATVIGVFLMTVSEPRESLREAPTSSRRLARAAMVAAMILFLARGVVTASSFNVSQVIDAAINLAIIAAVTIATTAILRYLARLASRLSSHELAKRTLDLARTWRWLLPCTAIIAFVEQINIGWRATSGRPLLGLLLIPVSCAVVVLPFFVLFQGIRTLSLLADYRVALGRCLIAARTRPNNIPSGNSNEASGDPPDWR